jgi:hypothetical protein
VPFGSEPNSDCGPALALRRQASQTPQGGLQQLIKKEEKHEI